MQYAKPEVVALGHATELILGTKASLIESFFPERPHSSADCELDD